MRGVLRQLFCAFVGGLSLFITGCWLGWPSAFLRKVQEGETSFTLNPWQIGLIVGLMDLANIISPIPTGYFMDHFGRKPAFIATIVVNQISWLLVDFAEDHSILLYIARTFAGIGKGMGFTILPMYLAEISERQVRGIMSEFLTLSLCAGMLFEFILSPHVSYLALNIVSSVFPLLCFILSFFMPESPYYLLAVGKNEAAWKSFCFVRGRKANEPVTDDDPTKTEMDAAEAFVKMEKEKKTDWYELVSTRRNIRACVAVFALSILQRLDGIASLLSYSSTTLPEKDSDEIIGPEQCVIFFGVLFTCSNVVCIMLLDHTCGRKPLLILSTTMCAFCMYAVAIYYILEHNEDIYHENLKWVPYVSILVYAASFSIGIGVVPMTLLGEYFPHNVKHKVVAVNTMVNCLASFASNQVYPIVSDKYGYQTMFLVFGTMNVISILVTLLFVYETKNKTFGEIEEMLNGGL